MSNNQVARIPLGSGDEVDALCRRSKRYFTWRAGTRKSIKRAYARRVRIAARREVRDV